MRARPLTRALLLVLPLLAMSGVRPASAQDDPHAHMDHAGDHASMGHADAERHGDHQHVAPAPVGVMVAHMLEEPLSFMLGYRYQYRRANGDMQGGSAPASDMQVMTQACQPNPCMMAPQTMTMNMHMIEFMFAPTSWLNFMIMPQFMSMDMEMRPLAGSPMSPGQSSTGGVGDLRMDVLVQLLRKPGHRVHLGLGVTAPVGSISETTVNPMNGQTVLTHYGMQLGSGTWDMIPTLTYAGNRSSFSWGAQIGGVARLESRNDSGYVLGDRATTHAWGGYGFTSWLSGTLRMTYEWQGQIGGEYDAPHSMMSSADYPGNQGGHSLDMGFGLEFALPTRYLDANVISIEWSQPLYTDFEGYQLERVGVLHVGWMLHF